MRCLNIMFDIDGTFLDNTDQKGERVNPAVFQQIVFFATQCKNVAVYLWSGRPVEQVEAICRRYGLAKWVSGCFTKTACQIPADIAFDDQQEFELADKNVIVRMK